MRLMAHRLGNSTRNRVAAVANLLTVVDDLEPDKLAGNAGLDLFFAGMGDVLADFQNGIESIV